MISQHGTTYCKGVVPFYIAQIKKAASSFFKAASIIKV